MFLSYTQVHPHEQLPHLTEAYDSCQNDNNNLSCNHNPILQPSCLQCLNLSQAFRRKWCNLTSLCSFPLNLICRGFIKKKKTTTYLIFLMKGISGGSTMWCKVSWDCVSGQMKVDYMLVDCMLLKVAVRGGIKCWSGSLRDLDSNPSSLP